MRLVMISPNPLGALAELAWLKVRFIGKSMLTVTAIIAERKVDRI